MPLFKKSEQEKEENERGSLLLCTAYKIYAEILRKRLEETIDKRNLLPENQGGFRKGRSTIANIFILNHLVRREGTRTDKKIYSIFVDLRTAFDNVGRETLWRIRESTRD